MFLLPKTTTEKTLPKAVEGPVGPGVSRRRRENYYKGPKAPCYVGGGDGGCRAEVFAVFRHGNFRKSVVFF